MFSIFVTYFAVYVFLVVITCTNVIRWLQFYILFLYLHIEITEPVLPQAEPLLSQFAARPVFVVGEVDDERLSATYWLAPPPVDEVDQDTDQVSSSYNLLHLLSLHILY